MQDHPKVSYRFDLGLAVPPWPSPWYQCLLTGAHEVEGERRVYQVMPYSGQVEGGHRFTDLNVQVADARSRRGAVRLQSRDPADQPVIEMGWFLDPSDRAAASPPAPADGGGPRRASAPTCSPPGRTWTTPTTCCAPSRPSTTRSAAAGWAATTTPRRSSTPAAPCAAWRGSGSWTPR